MNMTRFLVPTFVSIALLFSGAATVRAEMPREMPAKRATVKAPDGSRGDAMNAYRDSRLFAPEDFYGAAAILAASMNVKDLSLSKDLAMVAFDRGFAPGYRLVLSAHRRLMKAYGVRDVAESAPPAPKRFSLAAKPVLTPKLKAA